MSAKPVFPDQKRARFGVLEPPRFDVTAPPTTTVTTAKRPARMPRVRPETHTQDRLARQPGDVDREEE